MAWFNGVMGAVCMGIAAVDFTLPPVTQTHDIMGGFVLVVGLINFVIWVEFRK